MFTRRHLRPITLKISHTSSRAQSFTFFCILVVLFVTSSRSRVQTPLSNDGESRRRVENEMTFLAFLLLFLFSSSSSSTDTTPVPVDLLSRRANVLRTNNHTGNRARQHFEAIFTRREERSKANAIVGIGRSRGANEADESAGDFSAR